MSTSASERLRRFLGRAASQHPQRHATRTVDQHPEVPQRVCFTVRAYTSLLSEVLQKAPLETGGMLLGYRDGTEWVVVESTDPGPHSVHQRTYFEYDQPYVTHLINRMRAYYKRPLDLLGLWHRHPGSFDRFSGTDDETNLSFAQMSSVGAISGLVNVDPRVRLSLFHVDANQCLYTHIPYTVLGARESEQRAPLCDLEDLALQIERGQTSEHKRKNQSQSTVVPAAIESSLLSQRINTAIVSSDRVVQIDSAGLVAWSDKDAGDVLQTLDDDLRHFEQRGVALSMRYADEHRLELLAVEGGRSYTLCYLVLVRTSDDDVTCFVVGSEDTQRAVPFVSGLLQDAVSWEGECV